MSRKYALVTLLLLVGFVSISLLASVYGHIVAQPKSSPDSHQLAIHGVSLSGADYTLLWSSAKWCGYSEQLRDQLTEISEDLPPDLEVVEIDTDSNYELAEYLGIEQPASFLLLESPVESEQSRLVEKEVPLTELKRFEAEDVDQVVREVEQSLQSAQQSN